MSGSSCLRLMVRIMAASPQPQRLAVHVRPARVGSQRRKSERDQADMIVDSGEDRSKTSIQPVANRRRAEVPQECEKGRRKSRLRKAAFSRILSLRL